jgi:hypothetical protein
MPVLFRPENSTALVLQSSSPALLSGITVSSGGTNTQTLGTAGILVTGVALSYGVNIAYFTTLSESVYVYPLGNKIGKCVITGAALPTCSTDGYSNVDKLVKFYNSNKASNFSNVTNPIQIVIGSTNITGYLENMEINISSRPDNFGIAQFTLMLSVMPAGQK